MSDVAPALAGPQASKARLDPVYYRRNRGELSLARGPAKAGATKGGALLAVLWLSAALAAIAFSVATTVRGETERATTLADGIRAYYLACGGIERALQHALGGPRTPAPQTGAAAPRYSLRTPLMRFEFPTGVAIVEVIPETARLNLNEANPADLFNLLLALGAESRRAAEITAALIDWRSRGPGSPFDAFYLAQTPSFRARHASFEEVEEALLVKGMTPDIFYGNYARDRQGRLARLGGFRDCVSVYGTTQRFDVNSAEPALLVSLGVTQDAARQIVNLRRQAPILNVNQLGVLAGAAASRLGVGGNTIYTFRSTARTRVSGGVFSDVVRTVAAQVKFRKDGEVPPYHVLRWHDNVVSEVSQWQ
jgi:general secretion pathway protein K